MREANDLPKEIRVTRDPWWQSIAAERFWMEITARENIGANLNAPQRDKNGNPYWSYSLIKEISAGDVVFHYHSDALAIVGCSRVVGQVWEDDVIWAARGVASRKA